jgi:phage terminase large subunit-like protein
MPPPKGSVGAGEEASAHQMAFRRAKSTTGNTTADGARDALKRAFEAADLDRSGSIGANKIDCMLACTYMCSHVPTKKSHQTAFTHTEHSHAKYECMRVSHTGRCSCR